MAGELSKIEHAIHKAIIPEERPTAREKQRSARRHQEHSPDVRGRLEEWLKLEKAVQGSVKKVYSMFHFHFCFIDCVGNRVDQQET